MRIEDREESEIYMKIVLFLEVALILGAISGSANAEMIASSMLGNDPAMEKLCIERSKSFVPGKPVPFEIDASYVEQVKKRSPDNVFIALDNDSGSQQLVTCGSGNASGKYGPLSGAPENNNWHVIKPARYEPSIATTQGKATASTICEEQFKTKNKHPNFDHSLTGLVYEVTSVKGKKGVKTISGKKVSRYDVVVDGYSLYKSANSNSPDLDSFHYTCLLSPMLEFKAMEVKKQ